MGLCAINGVFLLASLRHLVSAVAYYRDKVPPRPLGPRERLVRRLCACVVAMHVCYVAHGSLSLAWSLASYAERRAWIGGPRTCSAALRTLFCCYNASFVCLALFYRTRSARAASSRGSGSSGRTSLDPRTLREGTS